MAPPWVRLPARSLFGVLMITLSLCWNLQGSRVSDIDTCENLRLGQYPFIIDFLFTVDILCCG